MPFVTEELWQRLPLREGEPKAECLMKASYPSQKSIESSRNEALFEAPMQVRLASLSFCHNLRKTKEVLSVVHAARSLAASHTVKKGENRVIINTRDAALLQLFERQADLIKHLSRSGPVIVQNGEEPKVHTTTRSPSLSLSLSLALSPLLCNGNNQQGAGVRIVDHRTQVYLPLDTITPEQLTKEVEKLVKKKIKLTKDRDFVVQSIAAPLYAEKVPLAVQQKDR